MKKPLQHVVTNTKGMYRGSENTGVVHPTWPPGLGDSEGSHNIANRDGENTVTDSECISCLIGTKNILD